MRKSLNKIYDNISKEELMEVLEDQVFETFDFSRHMEELAQKENLPLEDVRKVVKHHLTEIAKEMVKVTKIKRRIVLFGFLYIDIMEPLFYKDKFKNKL